MFFGQFLGPMVSRLAAQSSASSEFKNIEKKARKYSQTKIRNCYCFSITSDPADQKYFIRSKNNNKIAGK